MDARFTPLSAITALSLLLGACSHSAGLGTSDGGSKVDTGIKPAKDGAAGPVDAGSSSTPHDVLTQRADISRSGVFSHESVLTTANVNTKTFGNLFTLPVDGLVYAQPLYVSKYKVAGKVRNVLVVATAHNSIYAFDADDGGSPLWQVSLGPSIPNTAIPTNDIQVEIGATSTPVIDRVNGLLYVANKDYFNSVMAHHFHVLDLATGQEMKGSPVVMSPSVPGTVDNGTTLNFDTRTQLQRPGLLLLNGIVYAAFGSHSDETPYHGFIVGYQYDTSAGTLVEKLAWSSSQDGKQASLWQSGQGLTADSANNIYAMIANGTLSAQDGGTSYGEGFVKLSPTLTVEDWFAPSNYEELNETDSDIGAGGPILVPGTSLVLGIGKLGVMYVLDTGNMGHLVTGDTQVVQELQATSTFFGSPIAWASGGTTRLFLWGPGEPVRQYVMSNGKFATTPAVTSGSVTNIPATYESANPVGVLALSCNGDTSGSAILWATKPTANPNRTTVPGVLYAFDALTLKDLWNSTQVARDSLGNYAKFVAPTVANGKVYMATHSKAVMVYGLLPDAG